MNTDYVDIYHLHDVEFVPLDPILTEASIQESLHNKFRALQLYHDAVATQPDNPEAYVQLAEFELRLRDLCTSYQYFNHAYTLVPTPNPSRSST